MADQLEPGAEGLRAMLDGMGKGRRSDAFANSLTGVGQWGQDKRLGAFSKLVLRDYTYWSNLYRSDDMAGRIVDALPDECFRKGFAISVADDVDAAEAVDDALYAIETAEAFTQAHKFARAYGGAGIFIGANDGQAADMPLDEENIKSIDFLLPLDTFELVTNNYYYGVDSKYGTPQTYRFNRFGTLMPSTPIGALHQLLSGGLSTAMAAPGANWDPIPVVHESRILRFKGVFVNRIQTREQRGWYDSIFVRCENVLRDFDLTWSSAGLLMQDFAQAIVKMKGASALIASMGPTALGELARRVAMGRSTARDLVLDADDTYERVTTPVTGLPELLAAFARRLAAAADMPVTRLMGESPAGLNATGDQDADWWSDKVANAQNDIHHRPLQRLTKLLFLAKQGPTKGKLPASWRVKFHPLKQLNDLEQAQRRLAVAQADAIYITNQAVTPEEVAITRFGGDEYNADKLQLTETDPEKRALATAEQAEAAAALAIPGQGSGEGTGDEEPNDGTGG